MTSSATGIARYKDLCLDATSGHELATFWAQALGLEVELEEGDDAVMRGPTPAHTIWVNAVPEPKVVKHRLHIDVVGASAEALEGLGASVVDATSFHWIAMTDPEGGELCLFPRDEVPDYRLYELVLDCADHEAQSAWWQGLLGGERVLDDRGFSYLHDMPGVPFESLCFVPVPEPKTVKNRIHIDVTAPSADAVLAHGATLLRAPDEEIRWTVVADPEGNELCVFTEA